MDATVATPVLCASMGSFAKKLGHLMLDHKINRVGLARRMDVSKQTAGRWCDGLLWPDFDQARRLAKLFGVSLDWLANDEADYPPPAVIVARPLGGVDLTPLGGEQDAGRQDQSVAPPASDAPVRRRRKR